MQKNNRVCFIALLLSAAVAFPCFAQSFSIGIGANGSKYSSGARVSAVENRKAAKPRPIPKDATAGVGVVVRILSDDNEGSRHQRFILRLRDGSTLLIAHNIDLAPRVAPLYVGDRIEFCGEYEYNDNGGVIHWTHKDPKRRHFNGWLKRGEKYFE